MFHTTNINDICTNYFQGLEWVFRYYTNQCFDWRWKYNYHYPPLLVDLASHKSQSNYFTKPITNPFHFKTQLAFVLPPADFNFNNVEFQWAFCRYFWEGHLLIDDLSLDDMEKMER